VSSKCVVLVGASRGIGEAIARTYKKRGFKIVMMARKIRDYVPDDFIKLDIDNKESISDAMKELKRGLMSNDKLEEVSYHFLTGGSLQIESKSLDSNKMMSISWHNLVFPFWATENIIQTIASQMNSSSMFNYYGSAAAENKQAHAIYSASKIGLEIAFKKLVKSYGKDHYFFCFRMGIVDVKHKYFHQLMKVDEDARARIINENIPSGYLPTPHSLAEMICEIHNQKDVCNGMIADISGGNSWI
jgi:NADP-dependent 3-hydroxy acid dehydrogenase YdfG